MFATRERGGENLAGSRDTSCATSTRRSSAARGSEDAFEQNKTIFIRSACLTEAHPLAADRDLASNPFSGTQCCVTHQVMQTRSAGRILAAQVPLSGRELMTNVFAAFLSASDASINASIVISFVRLYRC